MCAYVRYVQQRGQEREREGDYFCGTRMRLLNKDREVQYNIYNDVERTKRSVVNRIIIGLMNFIIYQIARLVEYNKYAYLCF